MSVSIRLSRNATNRSNGPIDISHCLHDLSDELPYTESDIVDNIYLA